MVFERPSSLQYPKIWKSFSTERNGEMMNFEIKDLTEDMFEESMQLLLKYFTADEPPCKHMNITKHPVALGELEKLWRKTLDEKFSLACITYKDGVPKIVGLNVLSIVSKDDKDEPFQSEDRIWSKLFGAVDYVARSVDIFRVYNVDTYLTAYGLVVDPEYRGMKIGKEILLARIPLCQALNIKVTVTVFTAAASQVVASKAGFTTIFEISYDELANKGYVFPGVSETTKSSKLMALVIE